MYFVDFFSSSLPDDHGNKVTKEEQKGGGKWVYKEKKKTEKIKQGPSRKSVNYEVSSQSSISNHLTLIECLLWS